MKVRSPSAATWKVIAWRFNVRCISRINFMRIKKTTVELL